MDRTTLNKYKNADEKILISKIIDKITFCNSKNQIQVTDFLDLAQQNLVSKFMNSQNIKNYIFYGGYEEAERKVVIIYPEKLENVIKENKISFNEWLKVIKITLPNENKGKYEHRIYLGGLMKLGIKREKVGDILVDENGADVIIHKNILNFVLTNITELTRFQKAKIEEINLDALRKPNLDKEQITITVSSMRLDNIISELAKCSRGKASKIIEQERVFVNYEITLKQTKEIKEKDKITIRGKGRFEIKEILGNTRKGKMTVLIEK